MAQFSYGANGEMVFHAEYSIKGVDTITNVFPDGEKTSKLLNIKGDKWFRDVYNSASKSKTVRKIFYDFLILVFEKLTEGGMLQFPGKTQANITLKPLPDSSVKRLSSENRLRGINIIKSRYKVPLFMFDFGPGYARKNRFINVPNRILQKAFRNAENGKIKYTYYRKILT